MRILVSLLLLSGITGCGPLVGQLMKLTEGVREIKIVDGDPLVFKKGVTILVVPFSAGGKYPVYGDSDAAAFQRALSGSGYATATLWPGNGGEDAGAAIAEIRSMPANELPPVGGLGENPDLVLFGTVLTRDIMIAPMRGRIMRVRYRLEFFEPVDKYSLIVEIEVRAHLKSAIGLAVQELIGQVGVGKASGQKSVDR
ncbi:MAG: hypothetical protein KJ950_09845 [Proteobacteria bacterium]|nr:hypothetical protein [Pseudomonadota bacterium]MBU1688957.1 hypothetical protein [Pseudomonadota bacterium]